MGGDRRWDVFVAYASPDRDRARVLYRALVAVGLSVCFDEAVLRPGDNWHRDLPAHVRSSAVVVVLVSSHTADATYQNAEVILALDQVRREGARLVPVRLHPGAELPYGTEALHAMDCFDDDTTPAVADAIVDLVRNPSKLAPLVGSQVWSGRVPAVPAIFAGRDALLEQLRASTYGGGGAVLTQTIGGMGGVGKTTVAAALAEAQRHELDVVWWVRAEQPATLVADLAELAPWSGSLSTRTRPTRRRRCGGGWRPRRGHGWSCSTTPPTRPPSSRGGSDGAGAPPSSPPATATWAASATSSPSTPSPPRSPRRSCGSGCGPATRWRPRRT